MNVCHIFCHLKGVHLIEFDGIVLHHPTQAVVKVFRSQVDVNITFVRVDLSCIDKIGQEVRLDQLLPFVKDADLFLKCHFFSSSAE